MTEQEFMEKYSDKAYNDDTDDLLYWASKVEGNIGELAKTAQEAFLNLENALQELGFEFGGDEDPDEELVAMEASIAETMGGIGVEQVVFADEDGNDVHTIDCKPNLKFIPAEEENE